ncbi:MAG: hypothetical protein ABR526_11860 [Chthoniobacterales bacterium]
MKTHIEIKLRFARLRDGGLHEVLRNFAQQTEGWEFPSEQSEEYQRHNGSDAGFAVCLPINERPFAAVAIANLDKKHPLTFRVPNIVPRACSSLTVDEYNAAGLAFSADLGAWIKRTGLHATIQLTGPNRTLEDIIPGARTRQFFEAWLHTPTPLSHPSDLDALNRFICYLFRHRGKARLWEIEPYLIHDLKWKPETARSAVTRIETGLELLRVDRKF